MKLTQFTKRAISELSVHGPKAAYYYIIGHLRWSLHGAAIRQWYKKTQECKECFEQGQCVICGCPFNELAVSGKPCKKNVVEYKGNGMFYYGGKYVLGHDPFEQE